MLVEFSDAFSGAFESSYFGVFFAYVCIASALMLAAWTLGRASGRAMSFSEALLIFALTVVGGVSGRIGGSSRVSAVGQTLPAILALISGYTVFLFERGSGFRIVSAFVVLGFTVNIFFGFAYGSQIRVDNEINARFKEACFDLYFNPQSYTRTISWPRCCSRETE
jgi:hypothetical protein